MTCSIMARSLLALLFFAISASGKEILISDWLTPQRSDTKYYPDMDAAVGDVAAVGSGN